MESVTHLTVDELAAQLVGLIRRGYGKSVVVSTHNGNDYDVIQLKHGHLSNMARLNRLPGTVRLISLEDSKRPFDDSAPDASESSPG